LNIKKVSLFSVSKEEPMPPRGTPLLVEDLTLDHSSINGECIRGLLMRFSKLKRFTFGFSGTFAGNSTFLSQYVGFGEYSS